jgi:ankyrin repeat protein
MEFTSKKENKTSKVALIFKAAQVGDLEALQRFHDEDNASLELVDEDGRTAFHWATAQGKENVVQFLLEKGVNINTKDEAGWTPLMSAASCNLGNIVEVLCKNKGRSSFLFLFLSCSSSSHFSSCRLPYVFLTFSCSKVKYNEKNDGGRTALHYAASKGHSRVVSIFLSQSNILVDAVDVDGMTPLHRAVIRGSTDVALALLGKDRQTQKTSSSSLLLNLCTLFRLATELLLTLFLQFLENGADVNARNRDGETPLHIAAQEGHRGVFELLLQNDADPNALDKKEKKPIDYRIEAAV